MSEKICPECGAANPVSEEMCDHCGYSLEEGTVSAVAVTEKTCPACARSVTTEMRFCDGCGSSLTSTAPVVEPDTTDTEASRPIEDDWTDEEKSVEKTMIPTSPVQNSDSTPTDELQSPKSWKLTCVEGLRLGKEYLLYKDEMLAGRSDTESGIYPDLGLEDQDEGFVSRRHATIRLRGLDVTVEDMGAENGTLLNGRRLPAFQETVLAEGQVLRIGKVGLMLKAHGIGMT